MPLMSGKRALVEILKQEGVEVVFGNPGTTELPLIDMLAADGGMRYVLALQEGCALGMADGYAQGTGKLGVVNVHAAPGLGNAMGMLYDAQKAGSPVLVTAGQQDTTFNVTEPNLWADLAVVARPFVKWSVEVQRTEDLPRLLHRAAKIALTPPTGPVFVALPADVLNREADLDLGFATRVSTDTRAGRTAIAEAARILGSAQHPVIIAGDAVARSGALSALVKVAEAIGAPVYCEAIANTISFPSTHPLFRGTIPRRQALVRKAMEQHDVLFSVGGDLYTLSLPAEVEPLPPDLRIVHLDDDAWQLGKNYPTELAIAADPKGTLEDLAEALGHSMSLNQHRSAEARGGQIVAEAARERDAAVAKARADFAKTPVQANALMQAIVEALPADAVIVDEGTSSSIDLRRYLRTDDPTLYYGMRGYGIGWAVPAAVGVQLAHPNRRVVAITGDGSALYTIQSLWTAAHEKLPITFLVLNNRSYRILKQRLTAMKAFAAQSGNFVGMDMTEPPIDFVGLARSLGVGGRAVGSIAEFQSAFASALSAKGPTVIEVAMDPAFG